MRAFKLIQEVISRLDLNLEGLEVLTEVGSNNFIYTPIIAAFAGASKVYAWTRDSRFGEAQLIVKQCLELAKQFNLSSNKFEFSINERPMSQVHSANIITNLGFIRPIDKEFIDHIQPGTAIPYMCESWEFRDGDLDLDYCKLKGVKVAGTWENHPSLKVFNACAHLMAKMCFEAGFEIYQNKILVISNDHFGQTGKALFEKMECSKVLILSPFDVETVDLKDYDFIFLADYKTTHQVFSSNMLQKIAKHRVSVIHLCGLLDLEDFKNLQIPVYPLQPGYAQRMTRTLAYLGAKPIIELHAAGLKVGENLCRNINTDLMQLMV